MLACSAETKSLFSSGPRIEAESSRVALDATPGSRQPIDSIYIKIIPVLVSCVVRKAKPLRMGALTPDWL